MNVEAYLASKKKGLTHPLGRVAYGRSHTHHFYCRTSRVRKFKTLPIHFPF